MRDHQGVNRTATTEQAQRAEAAHGVSSSASDFHSCVLLLRLVAPPRDLRVGTNEFVRRIRMRDTWILPLAAYSSAGTSISMIHYLLKSLLRLRQSDF